MRVRRRGQQAFYRHARFYTEKTPQLGTATRMLIATQKLVCASEVKGMAG